MNITHQVCLHAKQTSAVTVTVNNFPLVSRFCQHFVCCSPVRLDVTMCSIATNLKPYRWRLDTYLADPLSLEEELLRLLRDDDRDWSTDFDFFFRCRFSLDCEVECVGEEAGIEEVFGFSNPSLLDESVYGGRAVPPVHFPPWLKYRTAKNKDWRGCTWPDNQSVYSHFNFPSCFFSTISSFQTMVFPSKFDIDPPFPSVIIYI